MRTSQAVAPPEMTSLRQLMSFLQAPETPAEEAPGPEKIGPIRSIGPFTLGHRAQILRHQAREPPLRMRRVWRRAFFVLMLILAAACLLLLGPQRHIRLPEVQRTGRARKPGKAHYISLKQKTPMSRQPNRQAGNTAEAVLETSPGSRTNGGIRDSPTEKCRVPHFLNSSLCQLPGAKGTPELRKLPVWLPRPDRFLLALCFRGRASNRHACMKRSIILAAFLNRALIVPDIDVCPRWDGLPMTRLYDLTHIEHCMTVNKTSSESQDGAPIVKRMVRLAANYSVKVDRLHCDAQGCPENWCSEPQLSLPRNSGPLFNQSKQISLLHDDIRGIQAATEGVRVLALGDLFYTFVAGYEGDIGLALGPLIGSTCQPLLRPPSRVNEAAAKFLRDNMKESYAALHMRRTDMLSYCQRVFCHFPPIADIARCVRDAMAGAGLRHLYVATDGTQDEIGHLKKLMRRQNIVATTFVRGGVKVTARDLPLVDKLLCAQAQLFFFQSSSTFAHHVIDLRAELGRSLCADKDLGGFASKGWREVLMQSRQGHNGSAAVQ